MMLSAVSLAATSVRPVPVPSASTSTPTPTSSSSSSSSSSTTSTSTSAPTLIPPMPAPPPSAMLSAKLADPAPSSTANGNLANGNLHMPATTCSPTTSAVPWSLGDTAQAIGSGDNAFASMDPTLLVRLEAKYRASSRFPAALYASLQTESPQARSAALQSTGQVVRSWVDACYNAHSHAHSLETASSASSASSPPSASAPVVEGLTVVPALSPYSQQSRSADSSPPPNFDPAQGSRRGSSDSAHLARSNSASSTTVPTLAQAAASAVNLFRSKSAGSSAAAALAARRSGSISLASASVDTAATGHYSSGGSTSISTSTTHSYASDPHDPAAPLVSSASQLESRIMLHLHLATLIRLATTCPYADVRSGLRAFLRSLKADFPHLPLPRPIHPSPSYFIASTHLIPLPATTDHETLMRQAGGGPLGKRLGYGTVRDVRVALDDVFTHSSTGRVTHLARVLAYFPRYLQKTHRAHRHLVRDMPGPLPRTWRLFVGLLAAAQLKNVPVASLMRSEYLHAGGDPAWLAPPPTGGVRAAAGAVPPKLVALAQLNALLAHQPWRLGAAHIARLVVDHGWSVGELVHAIVVLASAHAQCAMAFGTGVTPDVDTPGGAVYVLQEADEMRRGRARDESVDLSGAPAEVPAAPPAVMPGADLLASPGLGASDSSPGAPDVGGDLALPLAAVSAAELSLTDQLITRLMESASASSATCPEDDGVPVTPSGSFAESTNQDGSEKHRRQLFEKCEGPESMSDSETERDLVPPQVDHTYLRSVPPPTPCSTETASLHHWWTAPGTFPAMDAFDLSALTSMYTADPAICDGVTGHEDFNVKSPDYSVFRLTDWCWEDHGLELVSKYLGHELGEYLDEEFEEARHMTIYSLFSTGDDEDDDDDGDDDDDEADWSGNDDAHPGSPSVDVPIRTSSLPPPGGSTISGDNHSIAGSTSTVGVSGIDTHPFREAIWYYVLRLFGQSMDDYNYSMVNHFVNKRTKAFIKKVATAPHTLQYRDWMRMGVVLRPEEKAHVVVLVAEARKQAELVWALSAVVKYLDGGRSR